MKQTVDAGENMYIQLRNCAGRCFLVCRHILREASLSLLVQLYRAIPEPQRIGRVSCMALTHFLYRPINNSKAESPAG